MKVRVLFLVINFFITSNLYPQASLVKDIDNTSSLNSEFSPNEFTLFKDRIYYSDIDDYHGRELWVTDGTTQGTFIFMDIAEGIISANPKSFTEMNGVLYFSASDETHGTELWRTDGTVAGTYMVKDINPGKAGSFVQRFTILGNTLFMVAYHPEFGKEIWKTDGTSEGTSLVKDINAGINSCNAYFFVKLNGALLFNAKDKENGEELWRTDGTEAGTFLVKDIKQGINSSLPTYMTIFKERLYFVVSKGVDINSKQIWSSDGTTNGTTMFLSDELDNTINGYSNLISNNDYMFFESNNSKDFKGYNIWKTNGEERTLIDQSTPEKSVRLSKIIDDKIVYHYHKRTSSSTMETHLIVSETKTGNLLMDESISYPVKPYGNPYVSNITDFGNNNIVWFLSLFQQDYNIDNYDIISDNYSYVINSQKDKSTKIIGSYFYGFHSISKLFNGKIIYSASSEKKSMGGTLYISDGSIEGTSILKENTKAKSSNPKQFMNIGNKLIFATNNSPGLWISNGTEDGTLAIEKGFSFSFIQELKGCKEKAYFTAYTPSVKKGLWKSDGTADGTNLVSDFSYSNYYYYVPKSSCLNNDLVFVMMDNQQNFNISRTDGTNTTMLKSLGSVFISNLVTNSSQNIIYFDFNDGIHGNELWKTDGTASGTKLVKDIIPGETSAIVGNGLGYAFSFNDILYFTIGINGESELWKTNGTEEGTMKVVDFADEPDPYLFNFHPLNNKQFIFTNLNRSLWVSDGTLDGTLKLADFPFEIIDGNASGPQINGVIQLKDKVYFFKGIELWETDGTKEGTKIIDIFEDYSDGNFNYVGILKARVANDRIFYLAYSQDLAYHLWSTNGTPNNLRKIKGVKNVADMEVLNEVLFLGGEASSGLELWKYESESDIITSVESLFTPTVDVYPNPSSDLFTILTYRVDYLERIEVINSFGQNVSFERINQNIGKIQIKLDQESAGLYLFRITIGGQTVIKKVIKL